MPSSHFGSFEVWGLVLLWRLGFGAWSFNGRNRYSHSVVPNLCIAIARRTLWPDRRLPLHTDLLVLRA